METLTFYTASPSEGMADTAYQIEYARQREERYAPTPPKPTHYRTVAGALAAAVAIMEEAAECLRAETPTEPRDPDWPEEPRAVREWSHAHAGYGVHIRREVRHARVTVTPGPRSVTLSREQEIRVVARRQVVHPPKVIDGVTYAAPPSWEDVGASEWGTVDESDRWGGRTPTVTTEEIHVGEFIIRVAP